MSNITTRNAVSLYEIAKFHKMTFNQLMAIQFYDRKLFKQLMQEYYKYHN